MLTEYAFETRALESARGGSAMRVAQSRVTKNPGRCGVNRMKLNSHWQRWLVSLDPDAQALFQLLL